MKKILLVSLCFLMLCVTQVFAQNRTVTGTVTAKEDGLPIPGVTVKIKGATGGTQTNSAGKFSLSVPATATLEFSGVGYTKVSAPVKGDVLNISLATAANQLGEVVITGALGIKTQARELGYATAQINNKELTQAKITDISTGLQGKVSGLQVNLTDNGVDPTTRIVLRGNRSITGNNEALLVVDGVPIDNVNYINTINPEDVASVTVLKGAVAAAIYGSKASNGVLIITTKKGSKGKPSITVQNTTSIQEASYLPALQTRFGGYGGEGGSFVNPDGTVNPVNYENESYGPAFDGRKLGIAISPKFASDGVTVIGYDTLFSAYSNKPNNRRDFFNNAISNQFNVSYDIGNDNGTLHLGFQDLDSKGITPNDTRRQDNIRIGGTQTYGKFSVEYNASYNQNTVSKAGASYNQTGGGFSGDLLYFELLNTPANIPLQDFKDINSQYGNVNSYYNAFASNPYWTVANSRRNSTTYLFSGNVNLSYKATNWLTFSDRIGITQQTQQILDTRAGVQFAPWAIKDPQNAGNLPSSLKSVFPVNLDQTFFEQLLNNDFIANFNKKFGKFNLSGLAGVNTQQSYQRMISLEGDQLQFPGDYNISSTLGIPVYFENSYKAREGAVYESVTLAYNNYLFLTGTNRDEWSSVLAQAHNHYQYPSVDGSFVFTDGIKSLKDNNVLSYGKLHAGIAKVANINIGGLNTNPYGAYSLINPYVTNTGVATGFPFGSLGGYAQSSLSLNPDIKPELTTEYEFGVELGFLKDRIHFETTISHSDSRNQSLTSSVSSSTGFTQQIANAGLVTNDVQEFDLNVIPVKTRDWTWTVNLNYTHFANKVVSLSGNQHELLIANANNVVGANAGIFAVVGKPFPIIETNDWIRDPASGKVIVDPASGQPTPNPNLTEYGTTNPTSIFGVSSSLSYKGLSLAFVIDYRGGNQIFNSTASVEAFTGISAQSAQNGRQRFIFPNSVVLQNGTYVNNTSVAVNNGNGGQGGAFWTNIYGQPVGSLYVEDAAFIKLREATLTYTLPAGTVKSIGFIKGASIGIVGRNLLMIRPKSNDSIDPEFADTTGNGIGTTSTAQLPPTRFYGVNLRVSF